MAGAERIRVEIAYARPEQQHLASLEVPAGVDVAEVIARSGICEQFPEIDLRRDRVGIFGRRVSLESTVTGGDRIEIYRPLQADPKQARRQRAARRPRG